VSLRLACSVERPCCGDVDRRVYISFGAIVCQSRFSNSGEVSIFIEARSCVTYLWLPSLLLSESPRHSSPSIQQFGKRPFDTELEVLMLGQ
jgi:hypothetical protein